MLQTSLFLFHRDLRVPDNTALLQAQNDSDHVYPAKNKYFSHAAVQFMCESLEDIAKDHPLHIFHGNLLHTLTQIHKDVTVYAQQRDAEIQEWIIKKRVLVR
jgi:deoxyribodipyrimidine photolyase